MNGQIGPVRPVGSRGIRFARTLHTATRESMSSPSAVHDDPPHSSEDAANRGLQRPPFIYLASSALGLLLHVWVPVGLVPRGLGRLIGVTLILGAVLLFVAAVRAFRAAGTPVPGHQPTTAVVRHGPYRFSRNPIYLAFSLCQLGIALWISSLWVVVTLVGAVALMSIVVIPREERYLDAHFPSAYLPYRTTVRRWL